MVYHYLNHTTSVFCPSWFTKRISKQRPWEAHGKQPGSKLSWKSPPSTSSIVRIYCCMGSSNGIVCRLKSATTTITTKHVPSRMGLVFTSSGHSMHKAVIWTIVFFPKSEINPCCGWFTAFLPSCMVALTSEIIYIKYSAQLVLGHGHFRCSIIHRLLWAATCHLWPIWAMDSMLKVL